MDTKTTVEEVSGAEASVETAPKTKRTSRTTSKTAAKSAKTPAKKPAASRSRAPKAAVSEKVYLQFSGIELDVAQLTERARKAYAQDKGGEGEVKDVRVYVKPEDGKAYYVINDTFAGELELF